MNDPPVPSSVACRLRCVLTASRRRRAACWRATATSMQVTRHAASSPSAWRFSTKDLLEGLGDERLHGTIGLLGLDDGHGALLSSATASRPLRGFGDRHVGLGEVSRSSPSSSSRTSTASLRTAVSAVC